jgi:hypothetical protein
MMRITRRALYRLVVSAHVCVFAAYMAGPADADAPLNLTNISQTLPDNTWRWTAYVVGDKARLARISCVIYTLHPTFPKPVQKVCEKDSSNPLYPFAITLVGWGTFNLTARVEYKDGTSEDLVHFLDFSTGTFTVEDNADRRGMDISNASTPDLLSCQSLCRKESACRAYTFVPQYSDPVAYNGPTPPRCFLKKDEPAALLYKGVIAGLRGN